MTTPMAAITSMIRSIVRYAGISGMSGISGYAGIWFTVSCATSEADGTSGYAGSLLHELAHAISGAPDVSREFESQLTNQLGKIAPRRS